MFHPIRYIRSGCAALIQRLESERRSIDFAMTEWPEWSLRYKKLAVYAAWVGVKIAFLRPIAKETNR